MKSKKSIFKRKKIKKILHHVIFNKNLTLLAKTKNKASSRSSFLE